MGRATSGTGADGASRAAARSVGPASPWASEAPAVVAAFGVDPAAGLSAPEVHRRRAAHGRNRLRERPPEPAWRILLEQFRSLVILLLVLAAAAALATGRGLEAAAIGIVIAVNTGLGFMAERHAVRSMEALRSLAQSAVTVRRGGSPRRVHASELVPGDIVLLEAGDLVSADLRILEASRLEADESALTGESLPVGKQAAAVSADTPLAERTSMLHGGTTVVLGSGAGVVIATGMATQLGVIAQLASEARERQSPLERRLESLGRRLAAVAMVLAAAAVGLGLLQGREPRLMAETGIALAVAAIPEGLPVVATLALARGMWRMARRHALIERLAAVETLGATGVILTDKTGTLTSNRMRVALIHVHGGAVEVRGAEVAEDASAAAIDGRFRREDRELDPRADAEVRRAIEVGLLCTNASLEREGGRWLRSGDPMEQALLAVGHAADITPREILAAWPEVREEAFDPDTRMMRTVHRRADDADDADGAEDAADAPAEADGRRFRVAVKGAPDAVIPACTRVRRGERAEPLSRADAEAWTARAEAMAGDGLRVLAVAERFTDTDPAEAADSAAGSDLVLVGLMGMRDPPRPGVREAVQRCREAGITVVMVTGDQAGTALSIARAVGLVGDPAEPGEPGEPDAGGEPDGGTEVRLGSDVERLADTDPDALRRCRVFARMEPAHKMRLLQVHQDAGAVVAMTGDGINDTPALRAADIGVAMGRRGAEAARQAADMVLQDDDFASIVAAVRQGRAIFANIRRAAIFMLSTNAAEILAVTVAALAGWPLPLRPLQILYLNLLTDALPALALAIGAATGSELQRPPRDPAEPILARRHWMQVMIGGGVIAGSVLGALLVAIGGLGLGEVPAVTVSFLALAIGKMGFAFTLRDPGSPRVRNEITGNPWIWASLLVCGLLLVAGVHLPWIAAVLETRSPGVAGWLVAIAAAAVPLLAGELVLTVRRGRRRRRHRGGRSPGAPRSPRRCPAVHG